MFIAELSLYIQYLKGELKGDFGKTLDKKRKKYYEEFTKNLLAGIQYYRELPGVAGNKEVSFLQDLMLAENDVKEIDQMVALQTS